MTVQNYLNGYYVCPTLFNSSNPTFGIYSATIATDSSTFNCSFTRQNSILIPNYFDLNANDSPYLIAAYGPITYVGGKVALKESFFKIILNQIIVFKN